MTFYDMDGKELNVGDYVQPVEGRLLYIISRGEIAEYPEEVMFGQQVEDLAAFSILTAENLALQFRKTNDSNTGNNTNTNDEAEEIQNILTGGIL